MGKQIRRCRTAVGAPTGLYQVTDNKRQQTTQREVCVCALRPGVKRKRVGVLTEI